MYQKVNQVHSSVDLRQDITYDLEYVYGRY